MRNLRVQTKTIIVFVSIILFIPSCVWWKNFLSTFFFENIHRPSIQNGNSNKIKSSSLYDTKLESGELVKGQRLLFVEYDENGNVTHSTNGYFESFFTYEDNRCIEAKIFRDGQLCDSSVDRYEEDKRVETFIYNAMDSLLSRVEYKYEGDYMVESLLYNANETLLKKSKYKYYENGKPEFSEESMYDADGNVVDYMWSRYDKYGNLLESDGKEKFQKLKFEYKYDKDGKILESVGFKQDGSKYPANIYTYDEHGNCIKKVSADNSMGNILEYEYY